MHLSLRRVLPCSSRSPVHLPVVVFPPTGAVFGSCMGLCAPRHGWSCLDPYRDECLHKDVSNTCNVLRVQANSTSGQVPASISVNPQVKFLVTELVFLYWCSCVHGAYMRRYVACVPQAGRKTKPTTAEMTEMDRNIQKPLPILTTFNAHSGHLNLHRCLSRDALGQTPSCHRHRAFQCFPDGRQMRG